MDTDNQPKPNGDWTPSAWESERHPQPKPDAYPVLDPDPIPNIVFHPGDALTLTVEPDGHARIRLRDRHGNTYAVMDCDYRRPDEYRVYAIYYASHIGRRELLPVHPQPYQEPHTQPVPNTYRDPHGLTVFQPNPSIHPSSVVLTHDHTHKHNYIPGGAIPHTHPHSHAGADATSATAAGHGDDPHDHDFHGAPEPAP